MKPSEQSLHFRQLPSLVYLYEALVQGWRSPRVKSLTRMSNDEHRTARATGDVKDASYAERKMNSLHWTVTGYRGQALGAAVTYSLGC